MTSRFMSLCYKFVVGSSLGNQLTKKNKIKGTGKYFMCQLLGVSMCLIVIPEDTHTLEPSYIVVTTHLPPEVFHRTSF